MILQVTFVFGPGLSSTDPAIVVTSANISQIFCGGSVSVDTKAPRNDGIDLEHFLDSRMEEPESEEPEVLSQLPQTEKSHLLQVGNSLGLSQMSRSQHADDSDGQDSISVKAMHQETESESLKENQVPGSPASPFQDSLSIKMPNPLDRFKLIKKSQVSAPFAAPATLDIPPPAPTTLDIQPLAPATLDIQPAVNPPVVLEFDEYDMDPLLDVDLLDDMDLLLM